MATEVYKVKQDISLPRALRELPPRFTDGPARYEKTGQNYPAGSYVKAEQISPDVRERVEDGELEEFLEPLSGDEADAALALGDEPHLYGTFIPEHEVEAYLLNQYGHTTVPRAQVLELRDADVEAVQEHIGEIAGDEDRGDLAEGVEVPDLASVSRGEHDAVLPLEEQEEVEVPEGTEQPPGTPVGDTLAGAAGGEEAVASEPKKARRRKSSTSQSSSESSA